MLTHKGLNALLPNDAGKKIDWIYYENKYNIQLPNSYKCFVSLYKTGDSSLRNELCWYHDKELEESLLSYHYGSDEGFISFTNFMTLEEVLIFRTQDAMFEENNEFLRIIHSNDTGGGGVYLCLSKGNWGKIYKRSFLINSTMICLAKDIFDFARNIECTLHTDVPTELLYKNWGEDFWRIREKKMPTPKK